jgi:aromatic-L-amino-acid decarboxylase
MCLRILDRISSYLDEGPAAPVLTRLAPGEISSRLPEAAPESGRPMEEILADFESILYPGLTHWNSPRFMAYFPSVASAPGILGEFLAAGFSQNAMLWRTGPAATELELRVVRWLGDLMGLPSDFHGHIVDTASIASLLGLAAAREAHHELRIRTEGMSGRPELPRLAVYASEEAHFSIDKAVMTLGLGLNQMRRVSVDERFRMRPDALREAIEEDLAAGIHPLAVVATVGTTSSTSIDPVPEIASICKEFGLWLHVDAAYGGVAAIVPEKREILAGCDRADSIVVNPHKWLFTPLDCSAFLVRRPEVLRAAFAVVPEYVTSDLDELEALTNLADYGIQMGRRFRALKLWMVMSYFGREGLIERLRYHLDLASRLAEQIEASEGVELVAPVEFATVCFRFRPTGIAPNDPVTEEILERLNAEVMSRANAGGDVFLSHTKLRGIYTLRLAIGHIRTSAEDVAAVWDLLKVLAADVAGEMELPG